MSASAFPAQLVEVVARKRRADPEGVAFQDDTPGGWRPVTHRQFHADVQALGRFMLARGVQPGDRIGILCRPRYAWEVTDKATMLVGGINVGLDYKSSPEDLAFVIDHAGIRALVVEDADLLARIPAPQRQRLEFVLMIEAEPAAAAGVEPLAGALAGDEEDEPLAPRARPEDVATLIYTSGTTGQPKGIPLTHAQLVMNLPVMSEIFRDKLAGEHRTLAWVPLYNGTGRMMSTINYHLDVVQYFVRDPMTLFDKVKAVAPTYLVLMPRITEKVYEKVRDGLASRPATQRILVRTLLAGYRGLPFGPWRGALDALVLGRLRRAVWGPSLDFLLSGSAPIDPRILRFFAGMGVETCEVYGMSELSMLISMNRPGRVRYGSVGEPLPGMEVRIADDGEILVKSAAAIPAYWGEADAGDLYRDGYMKTGDLGELRDGYLYIVGRKKEIIKTSTGQRISPVAVENVYREVPGIASLMVVGNGRKYLTGLIAVEPEFAARLRAEGHDLRAWYEAELAKRHERLARTRRIQRVAILPEPFSVESGEMTTTLKLRRALIERKYQDLIDALYAED